MVLERHPEALADCRRFHFTADEPVHSKKLLGLCVGQGPQQLRPVRLPREPPIFGLRSRPAGAGDPEGRFEDGHQLQDLMKQAGLRSVHVRRGQKHPGSRS